MLGHDGDDLGVAEKDLAHFSRRRLAILKRQSHRHGSANPEVAFFQMWKKFTAQTRRHKATHRQKRDADRDRKWAEFQCQPQCRIVRAMKEAHDDGLGFLDVLWQQDRSHDRSDSECRNQRARQSKTVSAGHWAKYLAFYALHSEKGHESSHHDECRKQNCFIDLEGADEN